MPTRYTLFQFLHRNTAKIIIKYHYKKIENRFVSNIDLIVLRNVFDPMHKQKKQFEKYI